MDDYYRDEPRSRPVGSSRPGVHTTRTWSNNGLQFTVETTSFAIPGGSLESTSAGTHNLFGGLFPQSHTTQSRGSSALGTAFSLLGDVLSAQQQQRASHGSGRRGSRHSYVEDDMAYGDDEYIVAENETRNRPQGFISKFADRLINNQQRSRKTPRSHEQSPIRRPSRQPRTYDRSTTYRTEERHPNWARTPTARVVDSTDEDDTEYEETEFEDSDRSHEQFPTRKSTADGVPLVEALDKEAAHHSREKRKCQTRIEQESRRSYVSTSALQGLINEMREHEKAELTALSNLERIKAGGKLPRRPTHTRQRQFTTPPHTFYGSSRPNFEAFFGTSRSTHPLFADVGDMDAFMSFGGLPFGSFERMFNDDFFSGLPRATFVNASTPHSGFSTAHAGPQARRSSGPTNFPTATPKPPPNILSPEEARKLFKVYNERWTALAPVDMNIPFPCRGMQPGALSARDTIWAPQVSSPVSSWSDETVMQANTQAFFLRVVGLKPEYTEAPGTGRIVMGYDKLTASPEQSRELVEILKREKTRWHSDRLGRRNGGVTSGPNEHLQRDERARAVFHAVCELMEVAQ